MRLYGISEIARELGEDRKFIAQCRRQGLLPTPTARLAMGSVWTEEAIRPWLNAVLGVEMHIEGARLLNAKRAPGNSL